MRAKTASATLASHSLAKFWVSQAPRSLPESSKTLMQPTPPQAVSMTLGEPCPMDGHTNAVNERSKRPRTASDTVASMTMDAFRRSTSGMIQKSAQSYNPAHDPGANGCSGLATSERIRELEAQLAAMCTKLLAAEARADLAEARVDTLTILFERMNRASSTGRVEDDAQGVEDHDNGSRVALSALVPIEDPVGMRMPRLSAKHAAAIVYGLYQKEDHLCTGNGFLSLNLRPGCVNTIDKMLRLKAGDRVLWVGCGNGPELLSLALRHPGVWFRAIDTNKDAVCIAESKRELLRLANVSLRAADAFEERYGIYSHVYSTAIAGPKLYQKLRAFASYSRLCMLRAMWLELPCVKERIHEAVDMEAHPVWISGSGEQRQMVACNV